MIDPTKPGPTADRIAWLKAEIGQADDLYRCCQSGHRALFKERADDLRAELSRLTEADLNYLHNINTRPGPGVGQSIDPTQPGPTADRIIAWLERELAACRRHIDEIIADPLGVDQMALGGATPTRNKLCAELSRFRNEQPKGGDAVMPGETFGSKVSPNLPSGPGSECDRSGAATSPAPQNVREAFIQVLASLVAAVSLLKNGGKAAKKAAASDRMFDQMILDYENAIEQGRAELSRLSNEQPKGVSDAPEWQPSEQWEAWTRNHSRSPATSPGPQNVREALDAIQLVVAQRERGVMGRRKRTIRMYAVIFRDGSDGRRLYIAHWSWHARMKFASDSGKRSDGKEQLQERWRKAYQEGWRIVPVDVTLVKRKRRS